MWGERGSEKSCDLCMVTWIIAVELEFEYVLFWPQTSALLEVQCRGPHRTRGLVAQHNTVSLDPVSVSESARADRGQEAPQQQMPPRRGTYFGTWRKPSVAGAPEIDCAHLDIVFATPGSSWLPKPFSFLFCQGLRQQPCKSSWSALSCPEYALCSCP